MEAEAEAEAEADAEEEAEAGADARPGQMHKWRRRTSSTLNSPMEVVHLAVGLADIVANVARETRAVGPTMRAAGLSAREAAAENIILCASSGRRFRGSHGPGGRKHGTLRRFPQDKIRYETQQSYLICSV